MRIAVIGSWRPFDPQTPLRGTADEFARACHEIGREFARYEQEPSLVETPPALLIGMSERHNRSGGHFKLNVID
jgi:hypothetical protein